jgi:hypothetical protein
VIQKKDAEQAAAGRLQDASAFAEVVRDLGRNQVGEQRGGIDDVEGVIFKWETIVLCRLPPGRVVLAVEDVRADELKVRPPGPKAPLRIENARAVHVEADVSTR